MILADYPIAIPHRTPQFTRAALKYAADLLDGWDIRVRVIEIHVVPYGVPLEPAAINPKSSVQQVKKLARKIAVRISAEVVFARNWERGFRRVLSPKSTVLLPAPRSSRATSEKRLAARLRKFGHSV